MARATAGRSFTRTEMRWLRIFADAPHLLDCAEEPVTSECRAKHLIWWDQSYQVTEAEFRAVQRLRRKLGLRPLAP